MNICRFCCRNRGIYNFFRHTEICKKILLVCFNLHIADGDGLPSHICKKCEQDLDRSYRFISKCEAADKKLRSNTNNHTLFNIKDEVTLVGLEVNDYQNSTYNKVKNESHPKENIKNEDLLNNESIQGIGPEIKNEELKIDIDNDDYLCEETFLFELPNTLTKKESVIFKTKRQHRKQAVKKEIRHDYSCNVCSRVCINKSSLVVHLRSHTNEKPYCCLNCDKKYKDSGTLKRHIETKHEQRERARKFICETCGKGFYSKSDIKAHIRIHTGEMPYTCTECPKKFVQASSLLRHRKRHTGEKTFECALCSKKFCTKDELNTHYTVHSSERKFKCHICDTLFKQKNNLRRHVKLHLGVPEYICNYCGKMFKFKGGLKLHIDRKHSEKSGFCDQCAKHVSDYEVHMWRHMDKRPLKCEHCTSSFYELRALAHHINFRHAQRDRYKCKVKGCTSSFPSKAMIRFHTAKFHSAIIPFPCDKCSRAFYRKNDLARHIIGTHKQKLEY